jgi:hypothetical protein
MADNEFVSVIGKADFEGTSHAVGITLKIDDNSWTKAEPGGAAISSRRPKAFGPERLISSHCSRRTE